MWLRFSVIFVNIFMLCMQPDLTPPDFFLWGVPKRLNLFQSQTRTLDQLKDNIRWEIRNVPQETFPRVMENMAVRMRNVIGQRGAYVCGKRCLKFKWLIKAMEDKMPVTQTYRPNLQIDVDLVC